MFFLFSKTYIKGVEATLSCFLIFFALMLLLGCKSTKQSGIESRLDLSKISPINSDSTINILIEILPIVNFLQLKFPFIHETVFISFQKFIFFAIAEDLNSPRMQTKIWWLGFVWYICSSNMRIHV